MKKNRSISLPVIVEIDEDNFYIVSCPVFKGCHSYGKTIDEAMDNLNEAIEICIEETDYKVDTKTKYLGMREVNFGLRKKANNSYA
jgi:predicted RNase H-like HicB family nuclease